MPYEVDINRAGSSTSRQNPGLQSAATTFGRSGAAPHYLFYELEPAQVISVDITSTDARNIGKAKVRPLYSYATVSDNDCPEAWPLDSNIKSYPLKNEVVIVMVYNRVLYYTQRLNFFNIANNNITLNPFESPHKDGQDQADFAATAAGNPNVGDDSPDGTKAGKYFVINKKVQSLLPMEGDIIYEGRFGSSIRLGGSVEADTSGVEAKFKSSWAKADRIGAPIIILRSGQKSGGDEKIPYIEDINKDPSSIYITNGHIIPFIPSSKNQKSYRGSAPSLWDGNQVLISSDRLVFNARKEGMFFFSPQTIGFSTDGTFNVDAASLFIVSSPSIRLGFNASEPVMMGNAWMKIMIKLLVALATHTHPTPAGLSGFAANSNTYTNLINELRTALSNVSWTE